MDLLSGALTGVAGAIDPSYGLSLGNYNIGLGNTMTGTASALAPTGSSSLMEPYLPSGRPHRFLGVSPVTGRVTWFGPLGQPRLFTGDFAAAKRLRRIAGHARRRMG